jgi:hypothetical protein
MAQLTGNTGGAVQALPAVTVAGGRKRVFVANFAFAAQAAGSVIAMARLPLFAALTDITVITDTSTGSATLAFGDANTAALYGAAQVYTTINSSYQIGLAATIGAPITTGYDALSGRAVSFASPGEGGALYEDILMTTGAAALPASGNLTVIFEYVID